MTVYVDNMHTPAKVRQHDTTWCHLTADSTEELIAFAVSIGLKPAYIQSRGKWSEHFDVTSGARARAVRDGAVEVDKFEHVKLLRERWEVSPAGIERRARYNEVREQSRVQEELDRGTSDRERDDQVEH